MAESQVQEILLKLERIEQKLTTALADIDDHEDRIRLLESKGGKRWEALVGQLITLVMAAASGWLLGQIG